MLRCWPNFLMEISARYDYETVHSITNSTLLSHVAFIVKDSDGEYTPVNLPLTCVLGRYDPNTEYERFSDEQLDAEHKETLRNGPVEAYVHGNAASKLCRAIKESESGSVKVCITSTVGTFIQSICCQKYAGNRID